MRTYKDEKEVGIKEEGIVNKEEVLKDIKLSEQQIKEGKIKDAKESLKSIIDPYEILISNQYRAKN